MNSNSEIGLDLARQNIVKHFPLVGTLERINETMSLMEKIYPEKWFKGLKQFVDDLNKEQSKAFLSFKREFKDDKHFKAPYV